MAGSKKFGGWVGFLVIVGGINLLSYLLGWGFWLF